MAQSLNWKAAIIAGLVAGLVFMMLEMVLVGTIGGQSPWGPPRMIAAMAMGNGVLPPPATFDMSIMMVAMMIHFPMSIILAAVLGWAISHWRMNLMTSLIVGTIFGLVVYFVNFYVMTAFFPWFAMARGGIAIFAHAMFGLVLGWTYYAIAKPSSLDGRSTATSG
ncbi:MAG: hypothetical protein ABIP55_08350 [Tepidisphaeraceae bacterium]